MIVATPIRMITHQRRPLTFFIQDLCVWLEEIFSHRGKDIDQPALFHCYDAMLDARRDEVAIAGTQEFFLVADEHLEQARFDICHLRMGMGMDFPDRSPLELNVGHHQALIVPEDLSPDSL